MQVTKSAGVAPVATVSGVPEQLPGPVLALAREPDHNPVEPFLADLRRGLPAGLIIVTSARRSGRAAGLVHAHDAIHAAGMAARVILALA
jgi:hypothetical protein